MLLLNKRIQWQKWPRPQLESSFIKMVLISQINVQGIVLFVAPRCVNKNSKHLDPIKAAWPQINTNAERDYHVFFAMLATLAPSAVTHRHLFLPPTHYRPLNSAARGEIWLGIRMGWPFFNGHQSCLFTHRAKTTSDRRGDS